MNLPANIKTANLPTTYEAAKEALSRCASVDECKEWADRAAALASYARQAEDTELERMSQRIRARAVRRAGELLKEIEPATGAHLKSDAGDILSRKQAARDAGMSHRQMHTALRIANVSDAEFDSQVDSEAPPTLSALAQQGIKPRRPIVDLNGRDPKEYNQALHFIADIREAAKTLQGLDLDTVPAMLTDDERARVREAVSRIDAITDRIMARVL